MTVTVHGVTMRRGAATVLQDVTTSFTRGRVTGLIGPNGAGKTTLMKCVVGLLRPTQGSVSFADRRATVGYVPEHLGFIEHLSGTRNVSMLAALARRPSDVPVASVIEQVGLDPNAKAPTSSYSQGMRRRLGIAQMLVDNPAVAVLDEPSNGLDPDGIRWIRALVRQLAGAGATVILSSHLLGELELSCDRIVMLRNGRVTYDGEKAALEARVSTLRVGCEDTTSASTLAAHWPAEVLDATTLHVTPGIPVADFVEQAVRAGIRITAVGPATTAIEELYNERVLHDPVARIS